MKNSFVLAHLLFALGYVVAAAAELAGVLPLSVLNLPVFFGFYTIVGLLGIATWDYSIRSGPRHSRQRSRTLRPARTPAAAHPVAAWTHHTLSA